MPHLMVRKSNWHAGSDDRSQYFTMVTSSAQDAAIFAGGSVENASSLTPNQEGSQGLLTRIQLDTGTLQWSRWLQYDDGGSDQIKGVYALAITNNDENDYQLVGYAGLTTSSCPLDYQHQKGLIFLFYSTDGRINENPTIVTHGNKCYTLKQQGIETRTDQNFVNFAIQSTSYTMNHMTFNKSSRELKYYESVDPAGTDRIIATGSYQAIFTPNQNIDNRNQILMAGWTANSNRDQYITVIKYNFDSSIAKPDYQVFIMIDKLSIIQEIQATGQLNDFMYIATQNYFVKLYKGYFEDNGQNANVIGDDDKVLQITGWSGTTFEYKAIDPDANQNLHVLYVLSSNENDQVTYYAYLNFDEATMTNFSIVSPSSGSSYSKFYVSYGLFLGTDIESQNGVDVPEGYYTGWINNPISKISQTEILQGQSIGFVLPTLSKQTCLDHQSDDYSADLPSLLVENYSIIDNDFTLQTQEITSINSEVVKISQGNIVGEEMIAGGSMCFTNVEDSNLPSVAAIEIQPMTFDSSQLTQLQQVNWDDQEIKVALDQAPVILENGDQCSDSLINYWINPIDEDSNVIVSFSETNGITVKALSSGFGTISLNYKAIASYIGSTGDTVQSSFDFTVQVNDCSSKTVTINYIEDQEFILGETDFLNVPLIMVFTPSNELCTYSITMEYDEPLLRNIVQFTFDQSSDVQSILIQLDQEFSPTQTELEKLIGTDQNGFSHRIEVKADSDNPTTIVFQLIIKDRCSLVSEPENFFERQDSISQSVDFYIPAGVQRFDWPMDKISAISDCGALSFKLVLQDISIEDMRISFDESYIYKYDSNLATYEQNALTTSDSVVFYIETDKYALMTQKSSVSFNIISSSKRISQFEVTAYSYKVNLLACQCLEPTTPVIEAIVIEKLAYESPVYGNPQCISQVDSCTFDWTYTLASSDQQIQGIQVWPSESQNGGFSISVADDDGLSAEYLELQVIASVSLTDQQIFIPFQVEYIREESITTISSIIEELQSVDQETPINVIPPIDGTIFQISLEQVQTLSFAFYIPVDLNYKFLVDMEVLSKIGIVSIQNVEKRVEFIIDGLLLGQFITSENGSLLTKTTQEDGSESVSIEVKIQVTTYQSFTVVMRSEIPQKLEERQKSQFTFNAADYQSNIYKHLNKNSEAISQSEGEVEEIVEIRAKVSSVNPVGMIKIAFDPPQATVPSNWNNLFNETYLSQLPQEEQEFLRLERLEIMHITFSQNSDESSQKYFSSSLTEFTQAGLQINLNFSDPILVSQGEIADQVNIKLNKNYFLIPQTSNGRVLQTRNEATQYLTFTQDLPLLVKDEQKLAELEMQGESAQNIMFGQFVASFALQTVLSGALSMLWNIFNTLQLITALELLQVAMPANVGYLLEKIQGTVHFQVIPKEQLYDAVIAPLFEAVPSEDLGQDTLKIPLFKSSKTQETETIETDDHSKEGQGLLELFKGTNFLMRIFAVIFALVMLFIVTALLVACRHTIIPKCPKPIYNFVLSIERKLLFNSVIRALLEIYLMLCISMFYGFKSVKTETVEQKVSFIIGLMIAIFCFYFPFWCFNMVRNNMIKLRDKSFSKRFDSLYQNLDTYKIEAHPFTLVFCLRRLLFGYAICNLQQSLVFQIFMIDFCSTFILAYYICVKPMKNLINNFIQILNEIVILCCTWLLFLFTNYVPDPILRMDLAQYFIYIIGANISVNLLVLITTILSAIYYAIKRWYLKRQHKNKMQKVHQEPLKEQPSNSQDSSSSSAQSSAQSSARSSASSSDDPEDLERPSKAQRRLYQTKEFQYAFQQFYDNMETYNKFNKDNYEILQCYKFLSKGTFSFDYKSSDSSADGGKQKLITEKVDQQEIQIGDKQESLATDEDDYKLKQPKINFRQSHQQKDKQQHFEDDDYKSSFNNTQDERSYEKRDDELIMFSQPNDERIAGSIIEERKSEGEDSDQEPRQAVFKDNNHSLRRQAYKDIQNKSRNISITSQDSLLIQP